MATPEPTPPERVSSREVWVISIVHPGAIVRGGWAAEPQQYEYLKRARALACGTWEPPSHSHLLRGFNLTPTLAEVEAFCTQAIAQGATLSVDIECAGQHLVCVGFCDIHTIGGIVVRLRGPGGTTLWGDELPQIVDSLYDVLSEPGVGKWFHNGQAFDIPYLNVQGFEVGGFVGDTLLLQRYMFPDMDASLQGCGVFYVGVPAWKWLAKDNNPDEGGDGK